VLELSGRVLAFKNDEEVRQATVALDIRHKVHEISESGLLGLAFDPQFPRNGRLYITYVSEQPRQLILASFTVQNDDANRIDPASEQVLLALDRDTDIHHGGMLAFGPDEMLYVSVGDGGRWQDKLDNAQDLTKLFGKILRIDPSAGAPYGIPADNPFVDDPAARPEIWAYGLRNPWRFSFDSQGRMWIGDVGQGTTEELNLATPGANFGWNRFEGDRPFGDSTADSAGFTFPIVQYSHSIGGAEFVRRRRSGGTVRHCHRWEHLPF